MNISHNLLEQIGAGAFKYCENMTILDLSYNKLKRISPQAFDKTSWTTDFRLNNNQVRKFLNIVSIISLPLFLNILQSKLFYFILQLTSMSQVPMTYQKGIKVLNVSSNAIEDIPKKTFPKVHFDL